MERSIACPTLFRTTKGSMVVVHVDDIQAGEKDKELEPVIEKLEEKYTLSITGPFFTEEEYDQGFSSSTIRFLKRKFVYESNLLKILPDPKYGQKLDQELQLSGKSPKTSPCNAAFQEEDRSRPLEGERAARYRKCVGILLYVAQDRPDLQFAVQRLASGMSNPTEKQEKQLRHTASYYNSTQEYCLTYRKTPVGCSNLHQEIRRGSYDFPPGNVSGKGDAGQHRIEIFSDSDWAGDKRTRKSTSSGTFFLDGQLIFSFSRTQKTVSLSSAEAEYYAAASAVSVGIHIKEVVTFLTRKQATLTLHLDSSAAQGIIARQGKGRVKHLQIRTLFLQELHKTGELEVSKVGTKENTADIGTKPLSHSRVNLLLHWLGFQSFTTGQPIGTQELQQYRQQAQLQRAVSRIKAIGKFTLAALLLSADPSEARSVQAAPAGNATYLQEASWNEFLSRQETVLPSSRCSLFCVKSFECFALGTEAAVFEQVQPEQQELSFCRSRVKAQEEESVEGKKKRMAKEDLVETVQHLLSRIEDHSFRIFDVERRLKDVEATPWRRKRPDERKRKEERKRRTERKQPAAKPRRRGSPEETFGEEQGRRGKSREREDGSRGKKE